MPPAPVAIADRVELFRGMRLTRKFIIALVVRYDKVEAGVRLGWTREAVPSLIDGFSPALFVLALIPGYVYAERAASVVAEQILSMLDGRAVTPYDGYGACYIEFGGGRVARVEVTFMTEQGVQGGPFTPPSVELAADKEEFGRSRIARWFGSTTTVKGG